MDLRMRRCFAIWFGISLCFSLATSATSGQLEDGLNMLPAGNWAEALRLLLPIAEKGNPIAQNQVGVIYRSGIHVPQDYTQAFNWFTKAAKQDNPSALNYLSLMYRDGQGVPADQKKALELLTKAAKLGSVDAQFDLAVMHFTGREVPKDYIRAYVWCKLAATQNDKIAQAADYSSPWAGRETREARDYLMMNRALLAQLEKI